MRDWNINIMSYFDNWWTPALPWQPHPKRQGEESRDTTRPHLLIINSLFTREEVRETTFCIKNMLRIIYFVCIIIIIYNSKREEIKWLRKT